MAHINKTRIATSDPLNLCEGLPVWPDLGTLRLGMSSSGKTGSLVKSKPKILWYKFGVDLYYDFLIGICGPAFAVGMELEGDATGTLLSLSVSDDEVQAGMVAGFTFEAGAEIVLEEYHVFKGWKDKLDIKGGLEFDILGLFINAIKWAMENGGGEGDAEMKPFPNVPGHWGMSGSDSGSLGYVSQAVAEPKVYVPIDVVPEVEPLEAVNVALHALLGELGMGPTIWFGIPVSVGVHSITLDDVQYTNIQPNGNGKLTGTTTGTVPASPSQLKVELAHDAGFDFGVGVYAEVSILKIFSLQGHIDFSLLHLMGITVHGDTYYNTLQNTIGAEAVASACKSCSLTASNLQVILDPVSL